MFKTSIAAMIVPHSGRSRVGQVLRLPIAVIIPDSGRTRVARCLKHLLQCRSYDTRVDQGPYAWVQGRRATSKVTATSEGRLTKRYAWVPGRPTRRACLGVNLPLRVPPCKHYPEEVTELKMAALILLRYRQTTTSKKSDFSGQDKPFTQI